MNDTWDRVMALRGADKRHAGVANTLNRDELETILATAEFFGAGIQDLRQAAYDLGTARYRVFDWLAMCVDGRMDARSAVKVFAYSFIKVGGDVDAFIADLRSTDYDVVTDWEEVELGG